MAYKTRVVVKTAADMASGLAFGNALSTVTAKRKCFNLKQVIQHHYQSSCKYTGGDIGDHEVLKAIQYAHSKKSTKTSRHAKMTGVKVGLFATGATVGSIVPVAGTAVGAVGGLAAGVLVTAGWWGSRAVKKIYKLAKGTQGKHRYQCACTLMHNATYVRSVQDHFAALDALKIILGKEFSMIDKYESCYSHVDRLIMEDQIIKRIAKRVRST